MKRKLTGLLILALLAAGAVAAPWETVPPDHWAYAEIRWLQVEGYLQDLNPSVIPYRRGEIAAALVASRRPEGRIARARFELLEREFSAEASPPSRWSFFGGGRLTAGIESARGQSGREAGYAVLQYGAGNSWMGVYSSQRGDRDLAENPYYAGKKWNDITGFTEAAYVVLTGKRWEVKLGRDHLAWGPGTDHLILNDGPRGIDQFSFRVRWRWGQFSALVGQLSDEADSTGERSSRFLSGHRLEVLPWPWLRVGLSETLLFTGGVRLGSMNPFLPYYGELVNENSEGNGLLGLDVSVYPAPHWQAYGEILLDDVQLENKTPKDLEPAEWGWLIGGRWAGGDGFLGAGISYQGITNRTYNAAQTRYRYTNYGSLLGSDLGNDGDRLHLEVSCWPAVQLRLQGFFEYQRQGTGEVYASFDSSYLNYTIEQGYSEPFPTGIVERTSTLGLGVWAWGNPHLQFDGTLAYNWIGNAGNISGIKDEGWQGRATLNVRLEHLLTL